MTAQNDQHISKFWGVLTLPGLGFSEVLLLHACMKRVHENTRLVDSTSVMEVLRVYEMIPWAMVGSAGFGEGVFHAPSSD